MIYHVMKDGSVRTDIKGHIVPIEDARPLYELIHRMNKRGVVRKEKR